MANKWTPSTALSLAISKLEAQQGNELKDYGTAEHMACVRYFIDEVLAAAKAPLTDAQKAALKKPFADESDFLAYASNAKKKLIAADLLKEKAEQYE